MSQARNIDTVSICNHYAFMGVANFHIRPSYHQMTEQYAVQNLWIPCCNPYIFTNLLTHCRLCISVRPSQLQFWGV